ncbi:MAG: peptidase M1 [Saprospiraceae bacterium]|nr:peptidase M1 [Saprospiraceae bacterium]
MERISQILLAMTLWQACNNVPPFPEPGVSHRHAMQRKASVTNLEYDLTFHIPETVTELIKAEETIRFAHNGNDDLFLDFKADEKNLVEIHLNGTPLSEGIVSEHILLPKAYLKEQNIVEIQFIAGNSSLNRNDEFIYTLLVPDRARTVFPVMDQPDLKAKWTLALDIPADWEAVANGPVLASEQKNDRKVMHYKQTKLLPSYLFAFAAGRFKTLSDRSNTMTMYYRENDSTKVARNASEIFGLHQKALDWLEKYTGIRYPFQKFDFALIPTFQYGGMEHPGAIFYRERSLMLDGSASVNQKLRRASLIAHETAHMWFGDLVTMTWFDDVWLKEVFANFMAAKMVNPSFPDVDHDLRFLLAHYPSAYAVDRTDGSHPIQQSLKNLQDAGSLYGAIIYKKAPIVMRNLETMLGPDSLRAGLQKYLRDYSYANATWDDLIKILADYTDNDLHQWNRDWIRSSGMPQIRIQHDEEELLFEVVNHNHQWPQQIQSLIGSERVDFLLLEKHRLPTHGNPVFTNSNGKTYGYLNYDKRDLERVKETIDHRDGVGRGASWLLLWENFLRHKFDAAFMYASLLDGLQTERDPLILEYLGNKLNTVFWIFLDASQRIQHHQSTEVLLYSGMIQTEDPSLQRIYYDAYISIAQSVDAVGNLHKIWSDQLEEFSLPLSENDRIQLASQIALRDPDRAQQILEVQLQVIKNPDNRQRLEFLLPALSPEKQIRDEFFNGLLRNENRSQEPWVGEALRLLHHPLRTESSIDYILPSLEIIEEIKATGDIFFPSDWLAATLSGHQSKEAEQVVHKFLEVHPNLSSDLRNKILQTADMLFRRHQDGAY